MDGHPTVSRTFENELFHRASVQNKKSVRAGIRLLPSHVRDELSSVALQSCPTSWPADREDNYRLLKTSPITINSPSVL